VPLAAAQQEEYEPLESYSSLLEPRARAVLLYLRAQQIHVVFTNNDDDLKRINWQIALLEQCRALDERWTPVRVTLAELYEQRGYYSSEHQNYAESLADRDRSLELRPDDPYTLTNRGVAKLRLGDYTGAMVDFKRSFDVQPDHTNTMYNLACLFALQGQLDPALDWLARAIEREESHRNDARTDSDFDSIRTDVRFVALVGDSNAE
jgi:tetratricopeptide (TPR) repeat protein